MFDSYVLYTKKLEGEYKEAFRQIEAYVNANSIDEQSKEDMMSNLLDTFLTAQKDGRPVEKITGKSMEKFCKTFCSGYGIKEQVLYFLESTKSLVYAFFGIAVFDMIAFFMEYLEGTDVSFFTYRSEYNIAMYGLWLLSIHIVKFIADYIVKKIMFRIKKIAMIVVNCVRIVVIFFAFFAAGFALYVFWDEKNIANLPVWISFIVACIMMVIYRVATRKKRKNKTGFWDYAAAEQGVADFTQVEKKRYFTKNKKLRKKGLESLTKEEFLQAELAECSNKKPYFYIALPIVIVGIATLVMYLTNLFESIVDMCGFAIIMLIIEGVIMRMYWKFVKRGNEERINWINKELSNSIRWEDINW